MAATMFNTHLLKLSSEMRDSFVIWSDFHLCISRQSRLAYFRGHMHDKVLTSLDCLHPDHQKIVKVLEYYWVKWQLMSSFFPCLVVYPKLCFCACISQNRSGRCGVKWFVDKLSAPSAMTSVYCFLLKSCPPKTAAVSTENARFYPANTTSFIEQ